MQPAVSNPLATFSNSIPDQTVRGASLASRLFGAGLALAIAFDQSYDPTQVYATVIALLVAATLVRNTGTMGVVLAGLGSGFVFFGGTVLTHLAFGLAMLGMGAVGGLAGIALADRRGQALPAAAAFVAAVLVTGALQVAIVFSFE